MRRARRRTDESPRLGTMPSTGRSACTLATVPRRGSRPPGSAISAPRPRLLRIGPGQTDFSDLGPRRTGGDVPPSTGARAWSATNHGAAGSWSASRAVDNASAVHSRSSIEARRLGRILTGPERTRRSSISWASRTTLKARRNRSMAAACGERGGGVVVGNGVRISGARVGPTEPPRPVVGLALGARPLAEWRTDGPSPASCGIWPNLYARPTAERRAMWGRSDARYQGDVTPVAFYPASPWKALMRIARWRPSPRPIATFLAWSQRLPASASACQRLKEQMGQGRLTIPANPAGPPQPGGEQESGAESAAGG